jgi:hypothetical protein
MQWLNGSWPRLTTSAVNARAPYAARCRSSQLLTTHICLAWIIHPRHTRRSMGWRGINTLYMRGAPTCGAGSVLIRLCASHLVRLVVALAASGWLILGCDAPSVGPPGVTASEAEGQAPSHAVSKLLVVIEENHSLNEMRLGMPYAYSLAQRFGYATSYHAITHPSLPDYLASVSGRTHVVTDDEPPCGAPPDWSHGVWSGRYTRQEGRRLCGRDAHDVQHQERWVPAVRRRAQPVALLRGRATGLSGS